MGPVATGLGEVFHYVVTGAGNDVTEFADDSRLDHPSEDADREGGRRDQHLGGNEKQYQVRISPDALIKHGLTFDSVVRAVEENNRNVGRHRPRGDALGARAGARAHGERRRDQGIVITAKDGVPIRVGNVAEVIIGSEIAAAR